LWKFPQIIPQNFVVDFVVDFVVGAFSVKWKKLLKFHKKSKVDVVAGKALNHAAIANQLITRNTDRAR
jgi:hypothetical protein